MLNMTSNTALSSMTPQMNRLGRRTKCQHLKLSSGKYLFHKLIYSLADGITDWSPAFMKSIKNTKWGEWGYVLALYWRFAIKAKPTDKHGTKQNDSIT